MTVPFGHLMHILLALKELSRFLKWLMLNVVIFSTAPCLDVSSCDDAKLYNLSCLNIALYIPTINITVAATFYGLLFCCAQKQLLFYFFYEEHRLAHAVTVNTPSEVEGELGFH